MRRVLLSMLLLFLIAVMCSSLASAGSRHGNQLTIYNGHVARIHGPWGHSWNHDANGKVPMYLDNGTPKLAYSRVGGHGKAEITYNEQKMRDATPCGWDAMMRHEKAHAKGYSHGEGRPPDGDGKKEKGENPAFRPIIPIHCNYPANANNHYANKY